LERTFLWLILFDFRFQRGSKVRARARRRQQIFLA
jgi:hypothetical protein